MRKYLVLTVVLMLALAATPCLADSVNGQRIGTWAINPANSDNMTISGAPGSPTVTSVTLHVVGTAAYADSCTFQLRDQVNTTYNVPEWLEEISFDHTVSGINAFNGRPVNQVWTLWAQGSSTAGENVTAWYLTVYYTATPVTVPNVVGMAQAAAESAITSATLTVGDVTQAYSDTVAAGHVISQDPAGGASVSPGTEVDLVISLGPHDTDGDGVVDDEDAFPANPLGATDSDADGLGDEWEISFFGNLTTADETSDTDLDGVPDSAEFGGWALGLDPTDGTTHLPAASAVGLAILCLGIGGAAVYYTRRKR